MTKYCPNCKMPKSKHNIYIVQGVTFSNCEEGNCEDECRTFVSKKELLEMDMNHSLTKDCVNAKASESQGGKNGK